MKNLRYLYIVLLSVVFACDPLEDTYDELDEAFPESTQGFIATQDYTLLSEDYGTIASALNARGTVADSALADFVESNEALNASVSLSDFMPSILDGMFPQLNDGNAVVVNYNLYNADGEDFAGYNNAVTYTLDGADYATAGGSNAVLQVLSSEATPSSVIPAILESNIQDPAEGQFALARFDYVASVSEVPLPDPVFKLVDGDDISGFTTVDITMESAEYEVLVTETQSVRGDDWIDSFGTLEYYYGANSFFENFDGRIDDTSGSSNNRKNWIADNSLDDDIFDGSADYAEDSMRVEARFNEGIARYLSIAYPDALAADEIVYNVTFDVWYGNNGGGVSYTRSFIIDESATGDVNLDSDFQGIYFEFDGDEWEEVDNTYYLSSEDYNSMGDPGRFDNFSSSAPADAYLPSFLSQTYPFAVEGEELVVVYKFFNGSVVTIPEKYTFTNGEWTGLLISEVDEQYIKSEGQWNLDPTIVFTMTSDDYQIIVDAVAPDFPDLLNSFGTAEDLYGADSFFENFDIRTTSKEGQEMYEGLSTSEAEALAISQVGVGLEVLMGIKFSDQAPQVSGIDVFAEITSATYDGQDGFLFTKLQCVDVGVWEVVEGPVVP